MLAGTGRGRPDPPPERGAGVIASLREPMRLPDAPVPFLGRQAEFDLLEPWLGDDRPRVLSLTGEPGVGTSTLAVELARRAGKERRQPVCLLRVGTVWQERPDVVLLQLLGQLGAPRLDVLNARRALAKDPLDTAVELALRHLRTHPAVVVLDDVPDLRTGAYLLRAFEGTRCAVVLTSRDLSWPRARGHPVAPLDRRASEALVRAVLTLSAGGGPPSRELIERLARAAGGRPACLWLTGPLTSLPEEEVPGPAEPHRLYWAARRSLLPEERQLLDFIVLLRIKDVRSLTLYELVERVGTERARRSPAATVAALVRAGFLRPVSPTRYRFSAGHFAGPPPDDRIRQQAVLTGFLVTLARTEVERVLTAFNGTYDEGARVRDAGRASALLGEALDDHIALMSLRMYTSHSATIVDGLARYLVLRGDHHRLAALQRSVPSKGRFGLRGADHDPFRIPLVAAVRHLGAPGPAKRLLRGTGLRRFIEDPPDRLEGALIGRDLGDLATAQKMCGPVREALPMPFTAPEDSTAKPLRSTLRDDLHSLRGEILGDQGHVREASSTLDAVSSQHELTHSGYGLAWANLRRGRLALLTELHPSPDTLALLDAARLTFQDVGDERGAAWAATEVARALDTQEAYDEALAAHRSTEDVRGVFWTAYYSALSLADRGHPEPAMARLDRLTSDFQRLGDNLGMAWSLHQLAVLRMRGNRTGSGSGSTSDVSELLAHAHRLFGEAGCRHGVAWSAIEEALCRIVHRGESPLPLLAEARTAFRELGDQRGLAWAMYVKSLVGGTLGAPQATLLKAYRASMGPAEFVEFSTTWEARNREASALSHLPHLPPRPLRDFVLTSRPTDPPSRVLYSADAPQHAPASRCHIRLDLLEADLGLHVLVRVEPEPGHPWADGGAPWLTVTATPLTHMGVDPVVAHLRASVSPAHGAEFALAPHRPGVHRLRLTVAHEQSGAVLQQVETEIDLPDLVRPEPLDELAPGHAGGN